MNHHPEPTKSNQLEIDFNEFISLERKQKTSGIERQITISRYATALDFNFEAVHEAIQRCKIRTNDDFGVIQVRTSKDNESTTKTDSSIVELNIGSEWIRALFGVIGETSFRRLNFESWHIDEYVIRGILKETFLVEYYQQNGKLWFLTYGGSKDSNKIEIKHKMGFKDPLRAEAIESDYETVRETCLSFKDRLSNITYVPKGQPDYGDADSASLKTKHKKTLNTNAKLIREILQKPEILLREFEAWHTIKSDFIEEEIRLKFKFSKTGRVTLYVPEIPFIKSLSQIDFEDRFYTIIRGTYAEITAGWECTPASNLAENSEQLLMGFVEDVE